MTEHTPLEQLFDAMEDALCVIEILDPDTRGRITRVRYLHANAAFARHAGYSNVEGTTSDVAFPGLEPRWFEHLARVWRTGEPARFVEEAASLGRIYEASLSRIGNRANRRVACLFRDCTEQHHAQQRALQMAAELSEADRRKTEFLATLAHELRNPLAPIRTGLDLVESSDSVPAELASLHAMMSRQVGQLSRLVDELLDLSRISQDKIELRRERVPLSRIVDEAIETCRPLLEREGHTLSIEVPNPQADIDVDAVRLVQVLTNLLNNAVRYTPKGGHIDVSASLDEDGLHLAVGDDGEGLDADHLLQVFEMFTQVRGETPRENGGLGIGLTLSKRIVELHEGQLTASSPGRGRGSRFAVRIPQPARSARAADAGAAPAVDLSSAPPMRVLVVDDNRDAADALAKVLRRREHDTTVVYNGRAALETIETARPEVVLLDIGLPDITGYQVALEAGKRDYRDEITLIALTGWGMAKDRQRSLDAGFQHHLTKPVSAKSVLELLATIAASRPAR